MTKTVCLLLLLVFTLLNVAACDPDYVPPDRGYPGNQPRDLKR